MKGRNEEEDGNAVTAAAGSARTFPGTGHGRGCRAAGKAAPSAQDSTGEEAERCARSSAPARARGCALAGEPWHFKALQNRSDADSNVWCVAVSTVAKTKPNAFESSFSLSSLFSLSLFLCVLVGANYPIHSQSAFGCCFALERGIERDEEAEEDRVYFRTTPKQRTRVFFFVFVYERKESAERKTL